MRNIAKKKKSGGANKEEAKELELSEEQKANLTPWQKENMKYLKDSGDEPGWQPSVLQFESESSKKTGSADSDKEEKVIKEDTQEISSPPLKELPRKESFADKLPNLHKERRRRLRRRLSFIVTLCLLLLVGLIYYISPLSKLATIQVKGNKLVSKDSILQKSGLEIGDYFVPQYINKKSVCQSIYEANSRLKTVSLSVAGINQLKIKVTEYPTVAYSIEKNKYYPILENGVILSEEEKNPTGNYPILEGFKDSKVITKLIKEYNKLPEDLKSNISEIQSTPAKRDPELTNIFMNDQNQVVISIGDLNAKLVYYPQVVAQMAKPGIVDMEAGVYSKTYGSDQSSTSDSEKISE